MATNVRETRYQELFDRYRAQIAAGTLAPGDRLPSFPEFRIQGYGQATVEKALQMLEAQGLVQRTNGRGVFVSQAQPQLPKTGMVGFLGLRDGDGLHPYWSELLTGAQDALHHDGYDIVLVKELENIRWERLEGVLAFGYEGLMWGKQRPLTMPMAAVMAVDATIPYVEIDEFAAVHAATAHLLGLGHHKIAYLASNPGTGARYAGYLAALREAGIRPQESWRRRFSNHLTSESNNFASAAHSAMAQWLQEDWNELGCTAIMAWNDDSALGVMRALRTVGLQVPADVSVVGFDGSPIARLCDPPLATVHVPLRQMGRRGAENLLAQMRGETVGPGKRVFEAHFRPDASIRALVAQDQTAGPKSASKGQSLRRNSHTYHFQEKTS